MGSTKLQISTWRWLIFTLCFSAASASEMNIPTEFTGLPAIDAWAKAAFFGGFEKHSFSREGKAVVAVIGMPTSGVATSEIVVLEAQKNGTYVLLLARRRMFGIVTVKESDDAIVFSVKSPILIVPWTGIAVDMEQMRKP